MPNWLNKNKIIHKIKTTLIIVVCLSLIFGPVPPGLVKIASNVKLGQGTQPTLMGISEASAMTATTTFINFQGKVQNSDGTNVADGVKDFRFRIFNNSEATTSAALLWQESWATSSLFTANLSANYATSADDIIYTSDSNEATLKAGQTLWNITKREAVRVSGVNTGANTLNITPIRQAWTSTDTITNRIYVKDGIFTIDLNTSCNSWNEAACSVASSSGVLWGSDDLYLEVQFDDEVLFPRKKITAVPQAMNANALIGDGTIDLSSVATNTETAKISASTTEAILDLRQTGVGDDAGPAIRVRSTPVASSTMGLIQLTANPMSGANANGTFIAANPASFTGDFVNFQVGDSNKFKIGWDGNATSSGIGYFTVGLDTTSSTISTLVVTGQATTTGIAYFQTGIEVNASSTLQGSVDLNNILDIDISNAAALTVGDGTTDTFVINTVYDQATTTGSFYITQSLDVAASSTFSDIRIIGNATSTQTLYAQGLDVASSTLGNLTITGQSTTTGLAYFTGGIDVGASSTIGVLGATTTLPGSLWVKQDVRFGTDSLHYDSGT
ncbi:hypothetical protein KKD20_06105, partial [Patescibacteria group bacterium]|nr:hypothetical protein [Patescibacteria group bacterium]